MASNFESLMNQAGSIFGASLGDLSVATYPAWQPQSTVGLTQEQLAAFYQAQQAAFQGLQLQQDYWALTTTQPNTAGYIYIGQDGNIVSAAPAETVWHWADLLAYGE